MIILDSFDFLKILVSILLTVLVISGIYKFVNRKRNAFAGKAIWDIRPNIDIRAALDSKTSNHISRDREDFYLNEAHGDTSASEYFRYLMEGLGWPVLGGKEFNPDRYICFHCQPDNDRIWVWARDKRDKEFSKELNDLLEVYMNSGCQPGFEPIEHIVSRARASNGSFVDPLTKYGFRWNHNYDNL